jgi:hypothetical protein
MRSGASAATITVEPKEAPMRPTTHPRRIAAATLAVLAVAAPAATARPATDPPIAPQAEPLSAPPVQAAGESFDWGAAGVGAATTVALAVLAGGGFAALRRAGSANVAR